MKKVRKHFPYGRTYNNYDGIGYFHYTKGEKISRVGSKVLDKGTKFIMKFLSKAIPSIKV